VNSFPKTVTRQCRDCDLNPSPSAHESSTLTTRLPSHPVGFVKNVEGCRWKLGLRRCRFTVVTESLRRPFYTAGVDETNLYVEFSCFEQCKIESETIGDSVR